MVEKAYIEKIIDKYSYSVRIPKYNSILISNTATLPNQLYTAYACVQPGMEPRYAIGDIVWVTFESDYIDKPIILGKLYNENSTQSRTYINKNTDFYFDVVDYQSRLSAISQEITHCLHVELKKVLDANTQFMSGIYMCSDGSKNLPDSNKQGTLVVLPFNSYIEGDNNKQCIQLFLSIYNSEQTEKSQTIYCRYSKNDGTWKNWEKLHG